MIDFENGKTIISPSQKNFQVITNSTYSESVRYHSVLGKNINAASRRSEDRFNTADEKNIGIQEALEVLGSGKTWRSLSKSSKPATQ